MVWEFMCRGGWALLDPLACGTSPNKHSVMGRWRLPGEHETRCIFQMFNSDR